MIHLETEILYQISLVIGSSSNLEVMLRRTAFSLLRNLNATSCAILRQSNETLQLSSPACLLPRHPESNPTFRLLAALSPAEIAELPVEEPCTRPVDDHSTCYLYRLADFGVLAFSKHGAPLTRTLQEAFLPLASKLALAAKACLAVDGLRLAASVFANSQEGIMITDAGNHIVDVNQAFSRITGYSRQEALGHNPAFLGADIAGMPDFYRNLWRDLLANDHWRGEFWNRRKDGRVLAEIVSIAVIRNEAGKIQNFVTIFSDISHIKEHEAELYRISHFDPLTTLPNRRLLDDRLRQAMNQTGRGTRSLGVCLLDLDGFKEINDRFGHKMGDNLLCTVAARLKNCLREGDTIARLGGDEFILVLPGLSETEGCALMMQRILEAAATPVWLDSNRLHVTASIGVTFYPADDADADTLLRHADQAMYQAKQAGKNRYHLFDTEEDRKEQGRRTLTARARLALEQDEFRLHFQPKVNLHTGKIVGVEALLRWLHPEHGLLLPGDFLPALNGNLLEIDLGNWVIDECARQYTTWHDGGLKLPISLNVSAHHLQHESFVPRLQTALSNLPCGAAQDFQIEILETTAISRLEDVSSTLADCVSLGVSIALDDFGTGYSSLSYFRRLPINTLKIDREFIHNMLGNPTDRSIVESIVHLTVDFNRHVVAEGVESVEQASLLCELGCHVVQGFAISHPLPADQIPRWISDWENGTWWRQLRVHPDLFTEQAPASEVTP
jgi:diguanylate cyclase (GGDEF)-like protein/PAS domain S-box-containing protein